MPLRRYSPLPGSGEKYFSNLPGTSFHASASGGAFKEPATGTLEVFGFKLKEPAHVVLLPSFAPSVSALRAHFPHPDRIHISSRSTVVLDGADITIHSLDVDGTLVIKAAKGAKVHVKAAKAHNAGWPLVALKDGDAVPDSIRIRGFRVERKDQRVIEFKEPGEYVVDA